MVALGSVALGEKVGWWWMAIPWEPYFLALLFLDALLAPRRTRGFFFVGT